MRVKTLESAAQWVEQVGYAYLLPKDSSPVPSLWEAVCGSRELKWAVRNEHGKLVFTPEMEKVWTWKDELASKKLACTGKHLRGRAVLISKKLLPSFYALTGRSGAPDDFEESPLDEMEIRIAKLVLEAGPISSPEMREMAGDVATKKMNSMIDSLQRLLVITKAGVEAQRNGWPAATYDVTAKRYRSWLKKIPDIETARLTLARTLTDNTGERSEQILKSTFGWSAKVAREVTGVL